MEGGPTQGTPAEGLPRRIDFPYSRHSSYPELCEFVGVFKPRDVWPCTVNPAEWMNEGMPPSLLVRSSDIKHSEGKSIRSLFGEYCAGDAFEHDLRMEVLEAQMKAQRDSQVTSQSVDSLNISERSRGMHSLPPLGVLATDGTIDQPIAISDDGSNGPSQIERFPQLDEYDRNRDFEAYTTEHGSQESLESQGSARVSWARTEAYNAMMRNLMGRSEGGWESIALISTGHNHSRAEPELGDG